LAAAILMVASGVFSLPEMINLARA
jgi:hypothetical protein